MSSKMTIDEEGNRIWRNEKGDIHREDGPAYEWTNGDKYWYFNGYRHRIEGPAIEWFFGHKFWCVKGEDITGLVRELLRKSEFGAYIHLGILADYWAERGDFRLLDIVQPYLAEQL